MTGYGVTAQFYDAMADDHHSTVYARLADASARQKFSSYPILDIGAGTGLTTQAIARAVPEAEIFAVEPDPAMRPALMTRVWSDPDLRRRVSILPMCVLQAPLPAIISAAVASASLVHFCPDKRKRLWSSLAGRLMENGCALIEIQCSAAEDVAETRLREARIGQVEYEGWAGARRMDENRQIWRMTYISKLGGVEIDRQSTEFTCWSASADEVIEEASAAGLSGIANDGWVMLHKA